MGLDDKGMRRFGARWRRATELALPSFDIERGIERLLRARAALESQRAERVLRLYPLGPHVGLAKTVLGD